MKKYQNIIPFSDLTIKLENRNNQYDYFHHFFWNLSPDWLKEHRKYFTKNLRGFGEDAFHSMWYFVFNELKPKKILEIGVYRGQTISLFSLLAQKFGYEAEIHGISPLTSAGDKVSEYLDNLDYEIDVINNFDFFGLKHPILHKGFSDNPAMIDIIQSNKWDLIYIDGNHDYNVVKSDFDYCSKSLEVGGLLILDDAALYTDYKPRFYSTAGHPGPSKLANEINTGDFEEILAVGHNRVYKKLAKYE